MPKENNKMQIDIDNLFKQNVNDLSSIKELYKKLKDIENKILQIKYIDSNLVNKLKKEYEKLERIILDENIQAKLTNDIKTINSQMDTKVNKIIEIRNNSINQGIIINSQIKDVSYENYDISTTDYSFLVNSKTTGENLRITKSKIHSDDSDCIEINTPNDNIENTMKGYIITDNFLSTKSNMTGTTAGFGIGIAQGHDIIICNNIIKESRREGLHIEGVSRNILVNNNLFLNCTLDGVRILTREKNGVKGETPLINGNIIRQKGLNRNGKGLELVSDVNGAAKTLFTNNKIKGFDIGVTSYFNTLNLSGCEISDCNIALKPLNSVKGVVTLDNVDSFINIGGGTSKRKSLHYSIDGFVTDDVMDKDKIVVVSDEYCPTYTFHKFKFKSNVTNLSTDGVFYNQFIKAPFYFDGYITINLSNNQNFVGSKFKVKIKDNVITSDREMIWSNGNLAGTSLILKDGYLALQANSGSAFSNKVMDINMTGEIVYNYMNYNG